MLKDVNVSPYSWMNYGDDGVVDVPGADVKFVDLVNISTLGINDVHAGDTEYTIKEGDTLYGLSNKFYGTFFLWWVIAYRNEIDFAPVQLYGGRVLVIPDPVFVKNEVQL